MIEIFNLNEKIVEGVLIMNTRKRYLKAIFNFMILATLSMLISSGSYSETSCFNKYKGVIPNDGFVPDEITAVKIAEAVWLPIYGEKIYKSKPFIAKLLENEVWIVEGTLSKDMVGGVPYIEIQKADGKILKVFHSK